MFNVGLNNRNRLKNEFNMRQQTDYKDAVCVSSYKDLTIRKIYSRTSRYYAVMLVFVLILEVAVLLLIRSLNPGYIAFIVFTAIGLLVNLLDMFILKTATRSLDRYTKTLSEDDLSRIEKHTRKLGRFTQLVFMENEMIYIQSSIVKIYAYSKIEEAKENASMIELYDLSKHLIGVVPNSGSDATCDWKKVMTISRLQH